MMPRTITTYALRSLPGMFAALISIVLSGLPANARTGTSDPGVIIMPGAVQTPGSTPLPMQRWFQRRYEIGPVLSRLLPATGTPDRPAGIPIKVEFPESTEIFSRLSFPFTAFDFLELVLHVPADFPGQSQVHVFVKDWDDLWLQNPISLPDTLRGTITVRLPLSGINARRTWQAQGHQRPWHQLTASQLSEYGIHIATAADSSWQGTLYLQAARLIKTGLVPDGELENFRIQPDQAQVGKVVELSFEATHPFQSAFDGEDVRLHAEITLPGGDTTTISGFYYEGFLMDPEDRFTQLTPCGRPQFRFRFTPNTPGYHRVHIHGSIGKHPVKLPELGIEVAPDKNWRGVIRRSDKDNRFLVFSEDQSEFWGQGLNVRSPFDDRYQAAFRFSAWEPYNVNIYKHLFARYQAAGINVVEVWMSSWWLALEWMPDAPGNHGVGHYNQWRAWQLDQLLRWAEEHDIYLILAINNHGKFSTWCDQEWHRNPFNVAQGGYLRSPEEYFTHPRAIRDFQRLADYMIARWGYSSHILAWKLFTEIDLTGSRQGWYKQQAVADWHQQAASYFKERDPNRHLVTTHWSNDYTVAQASPLLHSLDELDFLTLDAYYGRQKGTQLFHQKLNGTRAFQDRVGKPCLITEFGGTPWADSLPHILQQLHLAHWQGFFSGFPINPCLWWFPLIEEQDLYDGYRAIAAFAKDEPRIGSKSVQLQLDGGLLQYELRHDNRRLIWVFDSHYFFENNRLHDITREHDGLSIPLHELNPGEYRVEFWNCRTGAVIGTAVMNIGSEDSPTLRLPAFHRDIALKIEPLIVLE